MFDTLSLPPAFLEKLAILIPQEEIENVYASFTKPRKIGVRFNTLKSNTSSLLVTLEKKGFSFSSLPWYKDGFLLEKGEKLALQETEEYKNGELYFQSVSSMLVGVLLAPKNDEKILDLTAAPGSKTAQIAALMNNTGEILANDRSRERLFKTKHNLSLLGVTNTKVVLSAGETLWKKHLNEFDKVLLDAPCSMEGRFISGETETYKDWSLKKSKLLSKIQRYLLRSSVNAVKPGGVIIYSTCTLSPEENEEVIDWILEKETDVSVAPISLPDVPYLQGVTAWKKKTFHSSLSQTVRILPSETYEGFFIAMLKKKA